MPKESRAFLSSLIPLEVNNEIRLARSGRHAENPKAALKINY
jgi:hypothetical protein